MQVVTFGTHIYLMLNSHILINCQRVNDTTLWSFRRFTYMTLATINAYMESYISTGVKLLSTCLLCNIESIRNINFNKCKLMLCKIKCEGFVNWCYDTPCSLCDHILTPSLPISFAKAMHRKVRSTKTMHKINARDVKETCACKNFFNSRKWHSVIAMCKIDVMQKRCTNVIV